MLRQGLPRFLAALFTLSLLVPAAAAAYDELGIYFDTDYTQNQLTLTDLPATVTGYLVLQNPTSGYPIHGWECCVDLEGPATFLNWELEGLVINVLDPPCFMVGIGGDPLPNTENVLLATFTLQVHEPLPVLLSVGEVQYPSYPDEMAYLSGAEADEILPMYPVNGLPVVASINEDNPWPELSHAALYFDVQPVGSTTIRNLTVTNVGGGYLPLDISVPDSVPDYYLTTVSGEHFLGGGQSLTIPVSFTPTRLDEITSVLNLGPSAPTVPLHGVGREPIISWTLEGNLDFPDVAVGVEVSRLLFITNTGEVPFEVDPFLGPGCDGFFLATPDPVTVQPMGSAVVNVVFSPPYAGEFACDLELGQTVPPQPMTGTAHDAVTSFTVTPDSLDFGPVAVTASRMLSFEIENTGETGIPLNVTLDDPGGVFQLAGVQGAFQLQPGISVPVEVLFSPMAEGDFSGSVLLGEVVPAVPLSGSGVPASPGCQVSPLDLDFGTVGVGSAAQRYFTVTNTGNVDLHIQPYETSDHFFVSPAPQTVPPGQQAQFTALFTPQAVGEWSCDISLGGPGCPPIHCTGIGTVAPPPGELDLVGIFFDEYYTIFEAYQATPGLVTGYLVLKTPSAAAGVHGWELRHEIQGSAILVSANLAGQHVNVGTPPDYIVGLAEPLPPSPDVLLATFTYFVMDIYSEATLLLEPASIPSVPGTMVYLDGSNVELILPMFPYTGYPEVAFINSNPLAADRPPAPELTADGGQVQLSWPAPEGGCDGFHVYRRTETGEEERLTGQPGLIAGDRVNFSDRPEGFAADALLYYSYTLLTGGLESARSPEVEYRVTGVPARVTRLLPNVPNPFNPQTTIRFQLAAPGPARITIYDLSGRLVRTLEDAGLVAGSHERVWQGRDNSGRQVPSGAYYVRLETPDGTDHRKIMLLK